jgi:hypothetical protein
MINFITVCVGDRYGAEYPNAILRMVKKHYKNDFNFFCVTDNPKDFDPEIKIIKPCHELSGWWNKMYMFSPLMPVGRLVYIDLDVLIIGDITDIIDSYNGKYCGDEDHIHWGTPVFGTGIKYPTWGKIDCSLGTALVMMESGAHPEVWDHYINNRDVIEEIFKEYGDQVYTSWALKGKFDLVERIRPDDHGFGSFKFDILGKMPKHLQERMQIEGIDPKPLSWYKFVNFHGKPKPFEVADQYDWIRSALGDNNK